MHFLAGESGAAAAAAADGTAERFVAVNYIRKRFRTYFDLHMGTGDCNVPSNGLQALFAAPRTIRRHRAN